MEGHVAYKRWLASAEGAYVFARQRSLVELLVAGWPRRRQTLVEVGCGLGGFALAFHRSGFDVSGIDREMRLVDDAREHVGGRCEVTLGQPEALPYNDKEFDFCAVLQDSAHFSRERLDAVLGEAVRVSRKGVLVGVWNPDSACGWLGRGEPLRGVAFHRGARVVHLLEGHAGRRWYASRSTLAGPPGTWREHQVYNVLNRAVWPSPWGYSVGGFCVVRFDLVGEKPLTPLVRYTYDTPSAGCC